MDNFQIKVDKFKEDLKTGEFFETLFNIFPASYFYVKDLDGRFITCSGLFAKICDVKDNSQLCGKTDYDVFPSFLADEFVRDDKKVIKTAKPIIDRLELVLGEDVIPEWRLTSKIPLFSKEGKVIGLAGVTRFIQTTEAFYYGHPEIEEVLEYIKRNYIKKITIEDLGDIVGMSVSSIERIFRKIFNTTPIKYLRKVRLNAACVALKNTDISILQIAKDCGFYDQSSMNRDFKEIVHLTPLQYRKRFSKK